MCFSLHFRPETTATYRGYQPTKISADVAVLPVTDSSKLTTCTLNARQSVAQKVGVARDAREGPLCLLVSLIREGKQFNT